jgi:hypothetical protein
VGAANTAVLAARDQARAASAIREGCIDRLLG